MSNQAPVLNFLAGGLTSPTQVPSAPTGGAPGTGVAFETLLAAQQVEIAGENSGLKFIPEALKENSLSGFFTAPKEGAANENTVAAAVETLLQNQTTQQLPQTTQETTSSLATAVKTELTAADNAEGQSNNPAPGIVTEQLEVLATLTTQDGPKATTENTSKTPVPNTAPSAATTEASQIIPATGAVPQALTSVAETKTAAITPQNNARPVAGTNPQAVAQTTGLNTNVEQVTPAVQGEGLEKQVQTTAKPTITTPAQQSKNDAITSQIPQNELATPKADASQAQHIKTVVQTDQRTTANTAESQVLITQAQPETISLRQPTRTTLHSSQTETDDPSETVKVNADGTVVKKSPFGKPANNAANQNTPTVSDATNKTAPLNFNLLSAANLYALEGQDGQILPQQTAELSIQAARSAGTMPIAPGVKIPVNLIAVNIAQHASQGINKFAVRLDPPELGRVEVKLEMTPDGKVSAHIAAERAETLDLLQRDARALERALNDTGLSANRDSLSFSLKDQAPNGESDQQNQQQNAANTNGNDDTTDIAQASQYRAYVTPDSVDIRI